MKKPIIIGENKFKYKKDAVTYYRAILNSYQFGESLTDEDYHKLFDLLEYGHFFCDEVDADDNSDFPIVPEDVKEALNKSTSDQRRANPPTPIRQWGFGE